MRRGLGKEGRERWSWGEDRKSAMCVVCNTDTYFITSEAREEPVFLVRMKEDLVDGEARGLKRP
jgi:hypothetical protein